METADKQFRKQLTICILCDKEPYFVLAQLIARETGGREGGREDYLNSLLKTERNSVNKRACLKKRHVYVAVWPCGRSAKIMNLFINLFISIIIL